MKMTFIVEGDPIGKERARKGRGGHWYTPDKTREYEQRIKMAYLKATGFKRMSPPAISVRVHCFFASKQHSDPDNVQKLVLDALQKLAYMNDRHVASSNTHQYDSERPRIEVEIE